MMGSFEMRGYNITPVDKKDMIQPTPVKVSESCENSTEDYYAFLFKTKDSIPNYLRGPGYYMYQISFDTVSAVASSDSSLDPSKLNDQFLVSYYPLPSSGDFKITISSIPSEEFESAVMDRAREMMLKTFDHYKNFLKITGISYNAAIDIQSSINLYDI